MSGNLFFDEVAFIYLIGGAVDFKGRGSEVFERDGIGGWADFNGNGIRRGFVGGRECAGYLQEVVVAEAFDNVFAVAAVIDENVRAVAARQRIVTFAAV